MESGENEADADRVADIALDGLKGLYIRFVSNEDSPI